MSKVRQLPKLYLRGAIASNTMPNLTVEEQKRVAQISDFVANHPEMQCHKNRVVQKLSVTIAADYADDHDAAVEEYYIAIWRGVVDLFYHHSYSYKCKACNSSTYMTKRARTKAIDRIQLPCPNCQMVEVESVGSIQTLTPGVFVTINDFQDSYKDLRHGELAPTCISTIQPIRGQKNYENPERIIDDPNQLRKFFGEFVWNYFRQQLNENKRQEHRKGPQQIVGPADEIIMQEILALCAKMKIEHNYCFKTEPRNGVYTINLAGMQTSPEFTVELALLRAKANLYGINTTIIQTGVTVQVTHGAPEISTSIIKPEYVSVLDNVTGVDDEDEGGYSISQISYRTVEGFRMDQENHIEHVDNFEVVEAIRDALPEGHCRDVFDIFRQVGNIYDEFSKQYGDGDTKINQVAAFLGITPKMVNQHKKVIEMQCLAKHFVPAH